MLGVPAEAEWHRCDLAPSRPTLVLFINNGPVGEIFIDQKEVLAWGADGSPYTIPKEVGQVEVAGTLAVRA